jgi:EamA domain-containing membrane protein RarD
MNLIQRTIWPTLMLLVHLELGVARSQLPASRHVRRQPRALALPWLFLFLFAIGWWLFRYADWQ